MNDAVTVVIAAHSERRWSYLVRAVESATLQSPAPHEVIVVVDHNAALMRRAEAELPGATVLANRFDRGASGTRNTGAAHAGTDLVAFLDDDAVAHPEWLRRLIEPFSDDTVVGTGGGVLPVWQSGEPAWFPAEFNWVVGASYRGMPEDRRRVRNVWSENMAVRRSAFDAVGGFRLGFGKLGDRSRPEDTDLCIRMAAAAANGGWLHIPDAVADHQVPPERSTFGFFLRRCYHEGQGKIEMARLLGGAAPLETERAYVRQVLPRGVGRGLVEAAMGHPWAAARSAAIVAGMLAVAAGVVRAVTQRKPRARHGSALAQSGAV